MLRKIGWLTVGLVMISGLVLAEPMRPLLNKENKFPAVKGTDVGFRFEYAETDEDDDWGQSTNIFNYVPLLRYRPFEPLTVSASVPFHTISPEDGDNDTGLGNVVLGAELLAFQDLFDYPWVLPYAEYVFDTGDDNGLSLKDRDGLRVGLAIGSKAWDACTFIVDGRYAVSSNHDNVASLGFAVVWDVSEVFAVLGEMRAYNQELEEDADNPTLWLGALSYKVSEELTIIGRGGAGANAPEDVLLALEAHYSL